VSNTNAELLLLKAQVHPHFLFNTLNNIYSFILHKSPTAGELVSKLTHIIRYMTTECDRPLVSLSKEIKLLQDYIGLEKIRYGNRLDLQVQIVGETENKMIVPLLMIPFIENSFKHGASRMLDQPWIKLNIEVEEERMIFSLSNSHPNTNDNRNELALPSSVVNGKHGLGLKNVKRRLQILYPANHSLMINSEAESFTVHLEVPLEESHFVNPGLLTQSEIPTYVRA
jgi:LytS/YehU family sensor histidine kinase